MIPKSVLACLVFIANVSSAQAATFTQPATESGAVRIAGIETKLFAHPYNQEKLSTRVGRLERFIYGGENSGPLDSRINNLVTAVASNQTELAQKPNGKPANTPKVTASSYPRVTELEKQLLEKSFENEPVTARLARLEAKVFGRVWSTQSDLAQRVDRLGEYAYMSPKVEMLERAEFLRVSMLHAAVPRPQPKRVMISVVDEIESLETMAFGKISASKPIGQRVDALELTFCGAAQTDKQHNITSRVALLLEKVNNGIQARSRV